MSAIAYADPAAVEPDLLELTDTTRRWPQVNADLAAAVPLLISATVQWIFFLSYWIPETGGVPGRVWWLTQLAPLASTRLTSAGVPQVPAQAAHPGLGGLLLLICAGALLICARSRSRSVRAAIIGPAGLGVVVCLVSVGALLIAGRFSEAMVSVVLLLAWAGCAAYATYHGWLAEPPVRAPKTWRAGLTPLVAYAVIGPAPMAVGRCLFGSELRDAAATLQGNTVALRLAGLLNASTVLLYLCGVLVGVCIWAAYQWWPPRRQLAYLGVTVSVAGSLLLTMALSWSTSTVAARQATTLRYGSPADRVHFSCGSWVLTEPPTDEPGPHPARTLVITGVTCRTVTVFEGYRQQVSTVVPANVSPVKAQTPEGAPIPNRVVAAQYGDVLVVAMSDRIDRQVNRLAGLDVRDGELRWQYACQRNRPLPVRFAVVPGGDRPELGYVTTRELTPAAVVRCQEETVRLDPASGIER